MLKLIAFDLDGTLGNTLPMCILAFEEAVSPYTDTGRRLTKAEIVETFGLNEEGMVRALVRSRSEEALSRLYTVYEQLHDEHAVLYEGVPQLLDFLRDAGVRLALVTGKGAECCAITLRKFGLGGYFPDVLTGNPTENIKARNIRSLVEKYGLDPAECLYIGDALSDIQQANAAGLTCLSAAWDAGADRQEMERLNPGRVFSSIAQLREYLAELLNQ